MGGTTQGQTPLMKQYYGIKSKNPDTLLLFRMGDFYETFDSDAQVAADVLGITLTKRASGAASSVPLAGFPHHALDNHLPKLVEAGLRVAICEQLEDPKRARKLVRRGVVEIVTPGVALRDQMLMPRRSRYLAALHIEGTKAGVAYVDASTGTFRLTQVHIDKADDLLQVIEPSEVLIGRSNRSFVEGLRATGFTLTVRDDWIFTPDTARQTLLEHFGTHSLKGFGITEDPLGVVAAGVAVQYLQDTQKSGSLAHIRRIQRSADSGCMLLDAATRRNLEILAPMRARGTDGTLVQILDHTMTPMGARRLRYWLYQPLRDVHRINQRLDAVEALVQDSGLRTDLQGRMRHVCDVERVVARTCAQRSSVRDLLALGEALHHFPEIKALTASVPCQALVDLSETVDPCKETQTALAEALDPTRKAVFRDGFNEELDHLRRDVTSGQDFITNLRESERARTGIPSLKVGQNKVFGYYIEITNTHRDKVPPEYIRKQTLVNAERYVTPEIKEVEARLMRAEEQIETLEAQLLRHLRSRVAEASAPLLSTAAALAKLDCLQSLAEVADFDHFVRPRVDDSKLLRIVDGRHPVVEKNVKNFIPNSLDMDPEHRQFYLITGPNMAGKSVVLRQMGLIVLLAQIGSFVPAAEAHVGMVDRIFTRVGASDDLLAGESTFMVEMNETANILNNATPDSLILLDEVGRGTSTFDGLSIAWALVEYLHAKPRVRARTLFATHYHELNELASRFERVCNYRIQVKEHKGKLIFLRRLVPGTADHSYGIEVARMAGLPSTILKRAQTVLSGLEAQQLMAGQVPADFGQPTLPFEGLDPTPDPVHERLNTLDPNNLTPMEALSLVSELKTLSDRQQD